MTSVGLPCLRSAPHFKPLYSNHMLMIRAHRKVELNPVVWGVALSESIREAERNLHRERDGLAAGNPEAP